MHVCRHLSYHSSLFCSIQRKGLPECLPCSAELPLPCQSNSLGSVQIQGTERKLHFSDKIQYYLVTSPARGTIVYNYSSEQHSLLEVLALHKAESLSKSMAFAVLFGSVLGVEPLVFSQELSYKSQEITWPLSQPF